MVLTEKRFLEKEVEFTVQTDLLDEEGTVWQSVTWFSIPFHQETLLVPLSVSSSTLVESLMDRTNSNSQVDFFACLKRNLT